MIIFSINNSGQSESLLSLCHLHRYGFFRELQCTEKTYFQSQRKVLANNVTMLLKIVRQYTDFCFTKDSMQSFLHGSFLLTVHSKVFLCCSRPVLCSSDAHPASISHLLLGWWYHHMFSALSKYLAISFFPPSQIYLFTSPNHGRIRVEARLKSILWSHYHSAFIQLLDTAMLILCQLTAEKSSKKQNGRALAVCTVIGVIHGKQT